MASAFPRVSTGPLVLAAAVPFLFLHSRYQPDLGFGAGGTHVSITLSDLAVLAVALAAIAAAHRDGLALLRRGLPIWLAAGALLCVVLVSISYPLLRDQPYDWHARLVSALKFCEYATLAPAVALLLPRLRNAFVPLRALVAWGVAATAWGVLQYVGLVHQFLGHRPAEREPSFLGYHDFAALSARCSSSASSRSPSATTISSTAAGQTSPWSQAGWGSSSRAR